MDVYAAFGVGWSACLFGQTEPINFPDFLGGYV